MITIYSGPVSWFSRKVEIVLHEKALPFRQVIVPFTQTSGYVDRPADVVRIHPKRQVPVLLDGTVELYGSSVIAEYLEDAYPEPALMPRAAVARAHCRQWVAFADEIMLEPLRALMHRTEPHDHGSDRWRDLERNATEAVPTISAHFDRLDRAVARAPYLVETYTLADIAVLMAVFWSERLAGPPLDERPHLARWVRTLRARPAVAKVLAEIVSQDRQLSAPVAGAHRLSIAGSE